MTISKTSLCQAKVALNEAGKISRRLNTEMKRYQAALDKGGNAELLFDATDDILETMDKLKRCSAEIKPRVILAPGPPGARGGLISKETTMINIRGAWVDTRKSIDCFVNLMKLNLNVLNAFPERAESVAEICIKNYDTIIAEMRKQRRVLVRARYELRKEQDGRD